MTPKLIFSSSAPDREFLNRLKREVKKRGARVVLPKTEQRSGTEWAEAIRTALESSDALVIVVPEEGTRGANNVFFELGAAGALGKPIVAVKPDRSPARRFEFNEGPERVLIENAAKKPIDYVADRLISALPVIQTRTKRAIASRLSKSGAQRYRETIEKQEKR